MNSATPVRILLAEDDDLVRLVAKEMLADAGYAVTAVGDGQEAMEEIQRGAPDLIVSDVRMPRCDGFELLQRVRQAPEFFQIPFVIVSAKVDTSDQRMGMSLGADDYVTKPYNPDDLLKTVSVRLERAAAVKGLLKQQYRFLTRILPHELRTPLTGILGYADLISQTGESGETLTPLELKEFGQNLQRSGQRLLSIAEDLTMWAWIESQREEMARSKPPAGLEQWVEPALIQKICEERATLYGRSGDFVAKVAPATVLLPGNGFHRVLRHLVENAFKFSLPGTLVEVVGRTNQFRYEIEVRDAGRGMTEEQLGSVGVMTQFGRDKYEQQGMGMGLVLARAFARLIGGSFSIERNPTGVGLCVRLSIPLAEVTEKVLVDSKNSTAG